MAWQITGRWIELCRCKMFCPCWMGPAEPDRGWCSGAVLADIQQGSSDGICLSGRKVAFVGDWPKDFASGNGTARLYIDEGAAADQRREFGGHLHWEESSLVVGVTAPGPRSAGRSSWEVMN